MEDLKQKYTRFILFLEEIIENDEGEYIKNLKNMEAYIFILGLKIRINELELEKFKDESKIIDEAYKKIIEKTNFNVNILEDEQITKFKRYINYFYQVCKIIN